MLHSVCHIWTVWHTPNLPPPRLLSSSSPIVIQSLSNHTVSSLDLRLFYNITKSRTPTCTHFELGALYGIVVQLCVPLRTLQYPSLYIICTIYRAFSLLFNAFNLTLFKCYLFFVNSQDCHHNRGIYFQLTWFQLIWFSDFFLYHFQPLAQIILILCEQPHFLDTRTH